MPYSSSLTDKEWEIVAPLLPQRKKTRPPLWTKRQILDGIFASTEEWLQLGRLTVHTYRLTQPYFGTTKTGAVREY